MKNTPRWNKSQLCLHTLHTPRVGITLVLNIATADPTALEVAVAAHDLVFSLVPTSPPHCTPSMAQCTVRASSCSMNETGLNLGIDHLSAIKLIDGVHAKGARYKFSWSLRGRLLVLLNSVSFLANGTVTHVTGADLIGIPTVPYTATTV
ncbi:hypothetical protein DFH08DRAFT_957804 [Mycena albidolilacea]|uniref:Uncharacterized protein n=1 Tax=Mycena albidolilacea TaxID=1033008 RepID=A0AAD7A7T3_9AGAR|nr:hypothetical protein DFH08DRAFT_957804 [Mycena albidolilacea]